jgi:hypothetical protein
VACAAVRQEDVLSGGEVQRGFLRGQLDGLLGGGRRAAARGVGAAREQRVILACLAPGRAEPRLVAGLAGLVAADGDAGPARFEARAIRGEAPARRKPGCCTRAGNARAGGLRARSGSARRASGSSCHGKGPRAIRGPVRRSLPFDRWRRRARTLASTKRRQNS